MSDIPWCTYFHRSTCPKESPPAEVHGCVDVFRRKSLIRIYPSPYLGVFDTTSVSVRILVLATQNPSATERWCLTFYPSYLVYRAQGIAFEPHTSLSLICCGAVKVYLRGVRDGICPIETILSGPRGGVKWVPLYFLEEWGA